MRPLTIRARLRLLALASAAPLLVFAVGLVLWHESTERQLLREQASRSAAAAMHAVDRELSGVIAGMEVLAGSPALATGDLGAFHAQARAAVAIAGNGVITLYLRDGTRVLSTGAAFGTRLPTRPDMSSLAVPFDSGRPYVTSLFVAPEAGGASVDVVVPVFVAGRVRYVLGARLPLDGLGQLLEGAGIPREWIGSLLDQQGTLIARTRNSPVAVGRKAVAANWTHVQQARSQTGTFEGVSQEGEPVFLAFARSGLSGWTSVVGLPTRVMAGAIRTWMELVAGIGAAALLLAWMLAWRAAKHIYAPLADLERSANCLKEGKVVEAQPMGVEQFDRLAGAMAEAGRMIAEREARIQENLEQLRRAHEHLRSEQVKKDQFIATLAHELRNPLAPLRTGVHVLSRAPTGPTAQRTLSMMERQLGHMVRLIDDLLDVSRIARGKLVLQKEDVVLQDLIAHAVDASMPLLQAGRHRFALNVSPDPIRLHADPTRISQVITNILNNAAKFTPTGGSVTLAAGSAGASAQVTITDTGIGIPPEHLRDVFELFSQIKDEVHSGPPGLGIGLSLARMLVELHGGSIEARSEGRGHGATFVIRLPTATAARPQRVARPAQRSAPGHALSVLLVDDNDDAADVLATALRMAGHSVYVAHDGPSALALAREHAAQVALLDIGMPGMSGYELCRRLRELPAYAATKIVALTGWGAATDREQARQAGFDDHLTKPVDWAHLEQVLADRYDGASRESTNERGDRSA